jgi:hypothetical protein
MTPLEVPRPVLARRLGRFIRRTLAGDTKGEAGRNLIRTGFPRSDISFKYFSRAFSSDGVRYSWSSAFASLERRP